MTRFARLAATAAMMLTALACQDTGTPPTLEITCDPPSIVSGSMSKVTAVVTQNNARAMGRQVDFSASDCGSMNPPSAQTSSGLPSPLQEGEAASDFNGNSSNTCAATITVTAVGLTKTCSVTVTAKPITVTALPAGTPAGTTPAANAQTVSIVPNVITKKNPFKATYAITTTPTSAKIFSVTVTVQTQSNIEHQRASKGGAPTSLKGVTMAAFVEETQLGDDVVTITSDGGQDGGTVTFSVGLVDDQDPTHVVYASFTGANTLPGPKP